MLPAAEQVDQIIREAEAARAQMYRAPGNELDQLVGNSGGLVMAPHPQSSTVVDENYIVVGGNIDLAIQEKIKKGEYMDFTHLLPRERPEGDDNRLELVYRGGQTYFVLASDRDSVGITSLQKWEQAFRVYSNVFLK